MILTRALRRDLADSRGMGKQKVAQLSASLNQLFSRHENLISVLRIVKDMTRLDLPFTSSSSIVVLESVDSFSFACDPSLFFAIMLLPYVELQLKMGEKRRRKRKADYDNEM